MTQALVQPSDCNQCTSQTSVRYPGLPGETGAAGDAGSNGVSAFTITLADFTVPAVSSTVTISVANSTWMAPGEVIFIQNAGYYEVSSKPSTTSAIVENLGYTGNAAPLTIIPDSQIVTPSGKKGEDGVAVGVTMNSISPTTTKGDLLVDNGVNSPNASVVRLAAPTDAYLWTADSSQPSGWLAKNPKLTATASLDFAAFLGGDSQDLTIPLVGAAIGDPVTLGCPATIPALLVPFAFVSAVDVVTVRMTAVAAVADPAAMNYTVRINKL